VKASRILIVDEFSLETVKTKVLHGLLKDKLQLDQVLIVDDRNTNLELSGRNIPRVKVLRTEGLNVYDIVRNEWVVFTKRAVQAIENRLAPTS
jgi:large subunit ribosomal protein L4